MDCQHCQKNHATVHLTEIRQGKRHELHLCEVCAQGAGYLQASHLPLNDLLTQFLENQQSPPELCPCCGLSWQEFKESGLLGCPQDYHLFEKQLLPLIAQAQQGALEHRGKRYRPNAEELLRHRVVEIQKLKEDLAGAVEAELYELAARLRDQLKALEAHV